MKFQIVFRSGSSIEFNLKNLSSLIILYEKINTLGGNFIIEFIHQNYLVSRCIVIQHKNII